MHSAKDFLANLQTESLTRNQLVLEVAIGRQMAGLSEEKAKYWMDEAQRAKAAKRAAKGQAPARDYGAKIQTDTAEFLKLQYNKRFTEVNIFDSRSAASKRRSSLHEPLSWMPTSGRSRTARLCSKPSFCWKASLPNPRSAPT